MADKEAAGPGDRSHAPARGILRKPETVAERVAYIAEEMAELRWERKTAKVLAEAWGVAESTVQNYSAEASRLVSGDADEARRDITVGARKLLREAVDGSNMAGFRQVAEVWAMVSGAKAPEKHQIGALDPATPGKAREVMAELFGGVTPETKGDADPER